MDALLFQGWNFLCLTRDQVKFQHLEERITILRGELDCKVQVILSSVVLEVPVLLIVGHRNAGTLAPDFTRLRDLSQSLVESVERPVEVL